MTAELRAYNPSWRDRVAQFFIGDEKPSEMKRRAVLAAFGSTGLGNDGLSLADATPLGMVFSGNDAVRSAQNGHYGEAALNALGAVPAGVVTAGLSKGSQAVKAPFQSLMKQFQEAENIANSSSLLHNPPVKMQRHISQDYPNGVPVDATGRITRDIEGRELTAPIIVGWNDIRGATGGTEIPLLPSQFATVSERSIGTRPTGVAGSTLGRKENGTYVVRRGSNALERNIYYRDSLSPEEANKTISHELGHMIDDVAGKRIGQKDGIPVNAIPMTGVKKDAGRVYSDMHTDPSDWRFKRQEQSGEPMPSKYWETPESIGYPKGEADSELMANAISAYASSPNYIKTIAPKLAARVREYVNSHPELKHIIQFNSIAAAGGLGAATMMPDDAKAAPMLDLLTNFMDRPVTQNRLLAPFLTGQGQQFSPRPNTNMLLQGADAAQQPAPPLSAPTEVLRKQVAEVPRAVDPMPTNSTSQAMPSQPPQSKSGGFFDGLSKFGESDFGQRLGDMMLGWGMGGTMQDSLSKGSQMIAAGNQNRKAKKEQFSTAEWLKKEGMDEEEAKYVAGNSLALNAYLIALRKGVDPMQALQQRKMELEINKLENPQLSPSDQLAREKFEWDKTQGGVDAPKIVELYDADVGQPYKATWNAATQTFDRIGGVKAPSGTQLSVGPNGEITFQQGSGLKPLTEGQSKDAVFATRAEGSLGILNQHGNALSGFADNAASGVPVVGNYLKSEGYQKAEQAGQEFLHAVLRKDTGAAITKEETSEYGAVYLPRPGDSAAVLQQKAASRQRALEALKAGMPPQAILQAEAALKNTDAAYPPAGTANINSQAEFDALPSGTQFTAPDGSIRRKP